MTTGEALKGYHREDIIISTNPVELAWAAGIIDGEGCVRIGRRTRIGKPIEYFPLIGVQMTSRRTIQKLVDILDFHKHIRSYQPQPTGKRQEIFTIEARNGVALAIAKAIWPYSITKKPNLAIILAWEHINRYKSRTSRVSMELTYMREKLFNRSGILNLVGKAAKDQWNRWLEWK